MTPREKQESAKWEHEEVIKHKNFTLNQKHEMNSI
jgi:hypothetical protein